MEQEFKDGKIIDLDYANDGWEVDNVSVLYDLNEDSSYNFDVKVIELDCIDTSSIKSDHIELRIKSEEYAWFVSSLIDDEELSQEVRNYLEKREKELPKELMAELEAEEKNKN